jgi:hypothetical protein
VGLLLDHVNPSFIGEDIMETVIRFCPDVLKARFEKCVWKETLSRSSLEFSYTCDWKSAFMSEGTPSQGKGKAGGEGEGEGGGEGRGEGEGEGEEGGKKKKKRKKMEDSKPPIRLSFLLNSMVAYHSDELLETTLVRSVIDLKWERYRMFGYISLLLHLAYLTCFTLLAFSFIPSSGSQSQSQSQPQSQLFSSSSMTMTVSTVINLLLIVLSSILLIFEIVSFLASSEMIANDWTLPHRGQKVLFNLSVSVRKIVFYLSKPRHWLSVFAFGSSLLFALQGFFPESSLSPSLLPSFFTLIGGSGGGGDGGGGGGGVFDGVVIPLSLLSAWLNTLFYLQTTPIFGLRVDLHVQMYFQVLRSLLSSILLFAVLLTGFAVTLVLLTSHSHQVTAFSNGVSNISFASSSSSSSLAAHNLVASLKVLVFTSMGDLQYVEQLSGDDGEDDEELVIRVALMVSIIFLVMVPLVAFNFLVALAVGDVNNLLSQAKVESTRTKATKIATIDNFFVNSGLLCLRKHLPQDGRIYPNRCGPITLVLSFLGLVADSPCTYEIPSASIKPSEKPSEKPSDEALEKKTEIKEYQEILRRQHEILEEQKMMINNLKTMIEGVHKRTLEKQQ